MTIDANPPVRPRSVGVVGGGTAGYFAALAIKRRFPDLAVTVVESKDVPIIGVGEATTTLMPPFLHVELGLDIVELFAAVKPTLKLGIKFEWGLPHADYYFSYPFGDTDPVEARVFDGDLRTQGLQSLLMDADRAPVMRGPDGEIVSLLSEIKFAYHLDNAPFVRFLASSAARAGIGHEDLTVQTVVPRRGGDGVEALRAADGRELRFDFYVDATGFRSLLVGGALDTPFFSYASSLFCDRALVGEVPSEPSIPPYTTAETMNAGWCWRIPVAHEDHRGYVFSSAFLDEEVARAELMAKHPGLRQPRLVRFRSGRHRDFWRGNVVAVGNAYGFVEPLESTALHMVIVELAYLVAGLEALGGDGAASAPARANEAIGAHWDYLRWFLAIHYKFNRRLDTPFWRAARADVDSSGFDELTRRYRAEGPWATADGRLPAGDTNFGWSGAMIMLLGQAVDAPLRPREGITSERWKSRVERNRATVRWSLPQREALELLNGRPELLRDILHSPRSWCRRDAERVIVR